MMLTSYGSVGMDRSSTNKFIPFDEIAKPSIKVRKQIYIDKMGPDGEPTEYDAKLYARLGITKDKSAVKTKMGGQLDRRSTKLNLRGNSR
jgi:hypothetical protein